MRSKKRDVSDLVSLIAQRNAHASPLSPQDIKDVLSVVRGRAVIDFSPAEGISSAYPGRQSGSRANRSGARSRYSGSPAHATAI